MSPHLPCTSLRMLLVWPGLRILFIPSTSATPWFKKAVPNKTVFSPNMATESSPQALCMDNWALKSGSTRMSLLLYFHTGVPLHGSP
eukprot:247121-Prorocentrum_lima.AAC.1